MRFCGSLHFFHQSSNKRFLFSLKQQYDLPNRFPIFLWIHLAGIKTNLSIKGNLPCCVLIPPVYWFFCVVKRKDLSNKIECLAEGPSACERAKSLPLSK